MISYKVTLTQAEREQLEAIKAKGSHRSQKVLNALTIRCIPPFSILSISAPSSTTLDTQYKPNR